MAANSPRKRNNGGGAPLPISALPLPLDGAPPAQKAPTSGLPLNSSGELTPAQRARLGLDTYGDSPAAAPISNGNGSANGNATAPTQPTQPTQPAQSSQPTEFGFTEIDPFVEPVAPGPSEPRLAPAARAPNLVPVSQATASRVRERIREDDYDADGNADYSQRERRKSIAERDGTPQMDRDRKVLTYGVSWTFFCIFATSAISFLNTFTSGGEGTSPGTFVPALISIVIGWVIVFVARNMGPNWGWLMLIPAVVLVLGPFFYASWQAGQTQAAARAYLSSGAAESGVDIDATSIVSETVNTPQGCFAFTKLRESGNVMVDVVTYAPTTAQQQATMSLAPRFARRVEPGGAKLTARTFKLDNGTLPVVVEARITPPIDCAGVSAP